MFRPRVIPILLLKNKGLIKSVKFKNYRYIGDPINAVKIFNDLKADELMFLDILASAENRTISVELIRNIGDEANMPFAVGGGISSIEQIRACIKAGAEKVVIGAQAIFNPDFIKKASQEFGSSTIVACIDVKRKIFGGNKVCTLNATKFTNKDPVIFAKELDTLGVGEIIVNSVDMDGTMQGYDLALVKSIADAVEVPVVAAGGAGNLQHLKEVVSIGSASAAAAGSIFVYHGPRNAVLVNYPNKNQLNELFGEI